jgi:hypothetical protein
MSGPFESEQEAEFERQRAEAARAEEERARRAALHDMESWARKQPAEPGQPSADPVHVVKFSLPEMRGVDRYSLARWSLAARYARDAADAGQGDMVTDLGPDAMDVARSIGPEDLAPIKLLHVGDAVGWRWVTWLLPVRPSPFPVARSGGPGEADQPRATMGRRTAFVATPASSGGHQPPRGLACRLVRRCLASCGTSSALPRLARDI